MKKYILFAILILVAPAAMAGNEFKFQLKFKINPDGKINKPTLQLKSGNVKYNFNDTELKVGRLRWNYKYPNEIGHKDDKDYLDMDAFKRYTFPQE